jgi:alkanesulfonate monooxygenase SsuD/methylene tetrahydromethanopterin reductase-like flavin-dependent oxidoreductase (luciferase family)
MASDLQFGVALITGDDGATHERNGWPVHLETALLAEKMGFDRVWVLDELFWRGEEGSSQGQGFWEGVAMGGAVAAATNTIGVGTWVLSALHRNPALTVKAIETIDEISGGRATFGFGAGHGGDQGRTFGYPLDKTIGRYAEALEIVIPAIRSGRADFSGEYHSVDHLINRPRGPQGSAIPILLGGHGPRTIGLAARYADIWSGFSVGSSMPKAYVERIEILERACEAIDRDPASIGRSVSAVVAPTGETPPEWLQGHLTGSPQQMAENLLRFAEVGVTSVELWLWPYAPAVLEAMAPVMEIVRAG